MKHYPIKKRGERFPVVIWDIAATLPKPKFPLKFFRKVHKVVPVEFDDPYLGASPATAFPPLPSHLNGSSSPKSE
jgi:hypothetical protein